MNQKHTSFEEYLNAVLPSSRSKFLQLHELVKEAVPETSVVISYNMPALRWRGKANLVYYAAFKQHVGFYPTASPIVHFEKELAGYKTSKGAIQINLNQELPVELIRRIIQFRVSEVMMKEVR